MWEKVKMKIILGWPSEIWPWQNGQIKAILLIKLNKIRYEKSVKSLVFLYKYMYILQKESLGWNYFFQNFPKFWDILSKFSKFWDTIFFIKHEIVTLYSNGQIRNFVTINAKLWIFYLIGHFGRFSNFPIYRPISAKHFIVDKCTKAPKL